jgi:hypothetical protein
VEVTSLFPTELLLSNLSHGLTFQQQCGTKYLLFTPWAFCSPPVLLFVLVQVGTLELMAVQALDALLLETSSYLGLVAKLDLAASGSMHESSLGAASTSSSPLPGDDPDVLTEEQ